MDETLRHRPVTQSPVVVNSIMGEGDSIDENGSECTGDTAGGTDGVSQAEDRGNSFEPELEDILFNIQDCLHPQ